MKVAICTPTMERPYDAYLASLEASVPLLDAAGIEHSTVFEVGCPYISHARCTMLTKALNWGADVVVFIDHDVSWKPEDLLALIQTDGDVVSGTYRFKTDEEERYMGVIETDDAYRPVCRADGCIKATRVPAGFLKVTRRAVEAFKHDYPDLVISDGGVDLFNHGAINGTWFGEDYAFSKRWVEAGGEIWLVPNLDLDHNGKNGNVFPGNFHEFMLRQPGGAKARP